MVHERRFVCHLCDECFEGFMKLKQHIAKLHPREKKHLAVANATCVSA